MAQEEIIKLLSEMVEIKSISSDKNHRDDVDASAQFVQNLFADLGIKHSSYQGCRRNASSCSSHRN